MPNGNVDALLATYDEWARGNFRAGLDLFDDRVLCIVSEGSPEPGVYLGLDEVNRWMRLQLDAWERLTIVAEEFIEAGDSVAVEVRRLGVGKGSGIPVDSRFWRVWEMRDGKAVRVAHREELGGEWS